MKQKRPSQLLSRIMIVLRKASSESRKRSSGPPPARWKPEKEKAGEKRGSHRLRRSLQAPRHRHVGKSPKLYGCFPRNNNLARMKKRPTKPGSERPGPFPGQVNVVRLSTSVCLWTSDMVWDQSGTLVGQWCFPMIQRHRIANP